jgi:hypothetical protein
MSDFIFIAEAVKQFDKVTIYSGLPISAFPTNLARLIDIRGVNCFEEPKLTWF